MKSGITVILSPLIAGMKVPIFFNCNSSIAPNTTKYATLSPSIITQQGLHDNDITNPANHEQSAATVIPVAGTFKKLYVWLETDLGAAGQAAISFVLNGTITTLMAVGGTGATGNPILISDLAHSFTVVPGDLVAFIITNDNLSTSSLIFSGAVEFDPS